MPVSGLEDHLGYWLRYVSNHVSAAFAYRLESRGTSVAEWVMLRELFEADGTAPSMLADRMGMTRGAITKLADRLIARALVVRREGGGDRRFQSLALTPKGRTLVPVLAAFADENDEEFFGHLSRTERARLITAMKGIVRRRALDKLPIE